MEAALFDMDGVLVDTQKYHVGIYKKIAKDRFNIDLGEDIVAALGGVLKEEGASIICKAVGIDDTKKNRDSLYSTKNSMYKDLIAQKGKDLLMDGSIELLEELKNNNVKMALCSASSNAKTIVKLTGLDKYFNDENIVDLNKIRQGKPAADIFLTGAMMLKVNPTDCVVYEDAVNGIMAAKKGGMYTVGFRTNIDFNGLNYGETPADRVVYDLKDPLCYRGLYSNFNDSPSDCKLFVFDAGNVIINNIECLPGIINEYKMSGSQIDEFLLDFKAYTTSLMDGSMKCSDFWKHLEDTMNLHVEGEPFARHFKPTLNKPVVNVIKRLKEQGYRVVLGSNTFDPHAKIMEEIGGLEYLDKCYMSHLMHRYKPAPSFFRYICESENIDPKEIFFVDDLAENVAAAAKFGMKTLNYKNKDKNEKLEKAFDFLY
ncbi:MAG: HAD-IA family hydrolase [Sphaerochaetaceae bacterium]